MTTAGSSTGSSPTIVVLGSDDSGVRDLIIAYGLGSVTQAPESSALGLAADCFILDCSLSAATGVLRDLKAAGRDGSGGVVIAVAQTHEAAAGLVEAGADDVIYRDTAPVVAASRIRTALEVQALRRAMLDAAAVLEERVRATSEELRDAQVEVWDVMVQLAEYRDDDTREHTRRVGETSALLAAKIGLEPDTVERIRLAAPLHDIGKIGISDATLLKAGPLTDDEFEQVKLHSVIGARVTWGRKSPVLKVAHEIALCHHERWDGSGYPVQFVGTEIPMTARIVSVADVFDALTHARPYKPRWPIDQSLAEMRSMRGGHFDPELVDAFDELVTGGALETIGWT